jgi:hypothetical protein
VPATLSVRRSGIGIELRRGLFDISVDNKTVGSLKWQETVEIPIDPGHHILRVEVGRYSSRDHPFDAAVGEVVNFRCHGAIIWPRYVASIVKPDLGISLKRE